MTKTSTAMSRELGLSVVLFPVSVRTSSREVCMLQMGKVSCHTIDLRVPIFLDLRTMIWRLHGDTLLSLVPLLLPRVSPSLILGALFESPSVLPPGTQYDYIIVGGMSPSFNSHDVEYKSPLILGFRWASSQGRRCSPRQSSNGEAKCERTRARSWVKVNVI